MRDETAPPVALVGLMGAGKSAVARVLGERLGRAVADLDAMVEAERGGTVAEIFAREGEAAFRRHEGRLLEKVLAVGAGVVACGGGVVLDPGQRRLLARRCRVVWLDVTPATAARRLRETAADRPLLAGGDADELRRRLEALLEARRPLYEEVAHARVAVDARSVDEVADDVLLVLQGRQR